MTTHELKCWPQFFPRIESGEKTFDVRIGEDRTYYQGDWIKFREFEPNGAAKGYTDRYCYKQIGYIMHGTMGLPDDVWVLGLD